TEQENPITRIVDAAQLLVELAHVATEAVAGRAAQDLGELEALRADAVIVNGDLRATFRIEAMAVQVHALEDLEDIGPATLDGGIARSVGTDDDVLGHEPPGLQLERVSP